MARRLSILEQAWVFIGPWLKSRFGKQTPYWFFLDVTTKCNMRCGYCSVIEPKGVTIAINDAKKAIDFMYQRGCRLVALMGGEPMLLGDDLTRIIEYATSRRMFTYCPTNLSYLDESYLDDLVKAGICLVDAAIDAIADRPGFDKNLERTARQFYLLRCSRRQGVIVKMNTVITRLNINDVKELTEISHQYELPISFHLVEGPMPGTPKKPYPWLQEDMLFRPEDYSAFAELADWLTAKQRAGYWISNPPWYFELCKQMVGQGRHSGWKCVAGQNSAFVGEKGELFPCTGLKWQEKQWGNIADGEWPFNQKAMQAQLEVCNSGCLSCGHTITSYNDPHIIPTVWRHYRSYRRHLTGR